MPSYRRFFSRAVEHFWWPNQWTIGLHLAFVCLPRAMWVCVSMIWGGSFSHNSFVCDLTCMQAYRHSLLILAINNAQNWIQWKKNRFAFSFPALMLNRHQNQYKKIQQMHFAKKLPKMCVCGTFRSEDHSKSRHCCRMVNAISFTIALLPRVCVSKFKQ